MITPGEWAVWTRGHVDESREFGLNRHVGNGYDGLKAGWSGVDEYAAIFSKEQLASGEFDTIFSDVDAHAAGENWKTKADALLRKCEVQPSRLYVTGRGAHLYWDLETPIQGVGRYKQVVNALINKWGIRELIDPHVIGDVRRVARLPGSTNSKGGWCMRVDDVAADYPLGVDRIGVPDSVAVRTPVKVALTIHEPSSAEMHFETPVEAKFLYTEGEYPPCIRAGIRQLQQTGELDHAQRLHVFSFLVKNDEMDKAWNILKNYAGDFDPAISGYQLGRMAETRHNPYMCANVPHDLCPFTEQRECAFWPSVTQQRLRLLEASGNGSKTAVNGPRTAPGGKTVSE